MHTYIICQSTCLPFIVISTHSILACYNTHLQVFSAVRSCPQSLVFLPQKEEGRCHVQYDQVLHSLKVPSLHCSWGSGVHNEKTFNITPIRRLLSVKCGAGIFRFCLLLPYVVTASVHFLQQISKLVSIPSYFQPKNSNNTCKDIHIPLEHFMSHSTKNRRS